MLQIASGEGGFCSEFLVSHRIYCLNPPLQIHLIVRNRRI